MDKGCVDSRLVVGGGINLNFHTPLKSNFELLILNFE